MPAASLHVGCSPGFPLGHGMALSHQKSCLTAAWKTLWHKLPGKRHQTKSVGWQTSGERLMPSSPIKARKTGALPSSLEPVSQRLPAHVGAEMPARCLSQQKWYDITRGLVLQHGGCQSCLAGKSAYAPLALGRIPSPNSPRSYAQQVTVLHSKRSPQLFTSAGEHGQLDS